MSIAFRFQLLLVVFMLCGCAQIPPYQDATGANIAKLRLKMEKPIISNLFLSAVDLETCKSTEGFLWLTGGVDSLYAKKVDMLDSTSPEEGVLEFIVPADKPLAAVTTMHIAKLNASEIMFAMNPSMQDQIRRK